MASKNLTRKYVDIRNSHKANRHLQVYSSDEGDEESATRTLLGGGNDAFESSGQSRDEAAQWQATLRTSLPPVWVDLIDQVGECVSGIQGDMRALSRLHAQRLMVNFDTDEADEEAQIDQLTRAVTKQFRQAEGTLKRFGGLEGEQNVSAAEQTVRRNMKRNVAKKLQGLSAAFRSSQKDYLKRISAQKAGCRFDGASLDFLSDKPRASRTLDGNGDGGTGAQDSWSDQQVAELEGQEELVNQRDAEITRIAQSIEELASIFKELAVLVIDQGTLLDRVDYNMEEVVDHTREGISQLNIAEESQKSQKGLKCVICLVVSNAVAATVLYFHWKREWAS